MPRYIDADLARAQFTGNFQDSYSPSEAKAMIDEVPTAEVEPIVHAHWICRTWDHRNDYYDVLDYPYRCSACREKSKELTKRCPECGAKMDKKE